MASAWGTSWGDTWLQTWGRASAPVAVVDSTGGWENYRYIRRRSEEEVRRERIKLGILPPDPEPKVEAPPKATRKSVRLAKAEPWRLTDEEIERLRHRITNDLDLEIAIHLREIERRKQQMLALILILDAA